MTPSQCPKCPAHDLFELVERKPIGSAVKLQFLQCASCGTVVGVIDPRVATLLEKLAKRPA